MSSSICEAQFFEVDSTPRRADLRVPRKTDTGNYQGASDRAGGGTPLTRPKPRYGDQKGARGSGEALNQKVLYPYGQAADG
jgi:hypothetical protein